MTRAAPKHRPMRSITRVHTPPEAETKYGQGRGGRPWRRKRARILERDGHLCRCPDCTRDGRLLLATEVDHIVPLSQGGTDDDSNLQAINAACHRRKSAAEAAAARSGGRGASKV